jgi:hypothetical protein
MSDYDVEINAQRVFDMKAYSKVCLMGNQLGTEGWIWGCM